MRWSKPDGEYVYTLCQTYRVSRAKAGPESLYKYTAWRKSDNGYFALGYYDDAFEAKARCEADSLPTTPI